MASFTSSSSLLIVLLVLLHFYQTIEATKSQCSPSACGIIPNISSPFRLKNDPHYCGYRDLELSCEDNVTSLYYNSHKFYVKDINYPNSTIRLVDASINSGDICSFPTFSAYDYNFFTHRGLLYSIGNRAEPVNFMSCPNPIKSYNSSLFTNITHCSSNYSSRNRYVFVKIGHMNASDVVETCMVEAIVMSSWKFKDVNNVSISEIHDSLVYGFKLTFFPGSIFSSSPFTFQELFYYVVVVAGLLCGVVSPPVMPIFGFAALSLLLLFLFLGPFHQYSYITLSLFYTSPLEKPHSALTFARLVAGALLLYPISAFLIAKRKKNSRAKIRFHAAISLVFLIDC